MTVLQNRVEYLTFFHCIIRKSNIRIMPSSLPKLRTEAKQERSSTQSPHRAEPISLLEQRPLTEQR